MGFVQNRVARDASTPPSLYGAVGLEAAVSGAARWNDGVDVAIVGGGITGLWTAWHLAAQGSRVAVLEAHQIGHGASGRAFGQLVPYLKHSHRKIVTDLGPARGEALSRAVAGAPAEIAGFIERHQIACAATRSGILIGARSEAGRRWLEETASWQPEARMLYGNDAAAIVGSDFYPAVLLDPRGFHVDPLAYARGLARVAAAHGTFIHPETRADSITPQGSRWEVRCGDRRLTAESVVLATNAHSEDLWPKLARSVVPFLVHGAVTEPLPDEALARILPDGQPLTDTRRLYSGVRRFGQRLHVSIDGASFAPRVADPQRGVGLRLKELYPWLPIPHVAESWSGWIALTADQYPHIHELAKGVWSGIGCNGRGLAAASLLGRDLAHLARGGSEKRTTFPVTPLRPLPLHDAAALVVAATASAKRWLDRMDARRK
jgi:glycine/D-amino acid oxidase-like deaminating enzyme